MKIDTIDEVLVKRDDEVVVAFKGILKSASRYIPADAKKKNSQSIQVITLEQDGKTIRAILKNRPVLDPALIGSLVFIMSHKGQKGWSGVTARDEDNKVTKTKERILRVTASAEIARGQEISKTLQDVLEGTIDEGQPPERLQSHPGKPGGTVNRRSDYIPSESEPTDWPSDPGAECDKLTEQEAVKEGIRVCWRGFNAMRLALRMAEKVRQAYTEDSGKELWPEHFRVITSTLFIMLRDSGVPRWLPSRPVALEEMMRTESSTVEGPVKVELDEDGKEPTGPIDEPIIEASPW